MTSDPRAPSWHATAAGLASSQLARRLHAIVFRLMLAAMRRAVESAA
jgi:hypothetical protein